MHPAGKIWAMIKSFDCIDVTCEDIKIFIALAVVPQCVYR
jgi:hypothetical protein